MAYFVTYQESVEGIKTDPSNIILRNTHPVTWAAQKINRNLGGAKYVFYLLFWTVVSELLITDKVEDWCEIEY